MVMGEINMKVKVYKVYPKKQTGDEDRFWYFVDAPSKRIAKWCGAACYNNEYAVGSTYTDRFPIVDNIVDMFNKVKEVSGHLRLPRQCCN